MPRFSILFKIAFSLLAFYSVPGFSTDFENSNWEQRIRELIELARLEGVLFEEDLVFLSSASSFDGFPKLNTVKRLGFESILEEVLSDSAVDWEIVNRVAFTVSLEMGRLSDREERDTHDSLELPQYKFVHEYVLKDFDKNAIVYEGGNPVVFQLSVDGETETVTLISTDLISGETSKLGLVDLPNLESLRHKTGFILSRRYLLYSLFRDGRRYLVARLSVGDREERLTWGGDFQFVVFPVDNLREVLSGESFNFVFFYLARGVHVHKRKQNGDLLVLYPKVFERGDPESWKNCRTIVFDPWLRKVIELDSADEVLSIDENTIAGFKLGVGKVQSWVGLIDETSKEIKVERSEVLVPIPKGWMRGHLEIDRRSVLSLGKGADQRVVFWGELEGKDRKGGVLYILNPLNGEIDFIETSHAVLWGQAEAFSSRAGDSYAVWTLLSDSQDFELLIYNLNQNSFDRVPIGTSFEKMRSFNAHLYERSKFFEISNRVYLVSVTPQPDRMPFYSPSPVELSIVDAESGQMIWQSKLPYLTWGGDGPTGVQLIHHKESDTLPLLSLRTRSVTSNGFLGVYSVFDICSKALLSLM